MKEILFSAMSLCSDMPNQYIPRADLFSIPEIYAVKVSPDSSHLAFVKGEPNGTMNLHLVRTSQLHEPSALKQMTHFVDPEIYRFFWTDDSKRIVFLKDTNGSKVYQLHVLDIETGELTKYGQEFKSASAKIYKVSGSRVAVGYNERNRLYHDVYVLDTQDGSLQKIFENDRFSRFVFDKELNIIFKEEVHLDGAIDVYRDDKIAMHFSAEDAFHSRLMRVEDSTLYYLDTRDSNTTTLKSLDLTTAREETLAHNEKSDINDVVFVNGKPEFYATAWLKKEWHSFGSNTLDPLVQKLGTTFEIISQNKDLWIIRNVVPQKIGASYYLYDLRTENLTSLYEAKTHPQLVDMIPFEFETRDGLKLTAYMSLPKEYPTFESVREPIPLIVFPHGGPFQARDHWTFYPHHQWLASRGYAVLSLNFRTSSGFGKELVNAGNGEWGKKALLDLVDGVNWAVHKGITTHSKVGILGGSYGGYTTLAALAFMPKTFVVGVDIVGPSSLVTVLEKVPKYWDFPPYPLSDAERFYTRGAFVKSMGGAPEDPAGRESLLSRSPLYFASRIEQPLLIIQGDNDPIVTKQESVQIFNELKRLNKKTSFLSFSDEGHQFRRYANIDTYLAHAEKWLHESLGGRFEPINSALQSESSAKCEELMPQGCN